MLPYKLTICGLNELSEVVPSGINHVISILDPDWPYPSELASIDADKRVAFRFDDVTVSQEGRMEPGTADIEKLLEWGGKLLQGGGNHLLVHCHAGVSRSTAAAAILMLDQNPGLEDQVFREIDSLRPRNWPNSMMVRLADDLLNCQGRFVAELRNHHASMAERYPDLAELIRLHGRAHEVPEGK
jgi:predicted protein tyrosine phosphatase